MILKCLSNGEVEDFDTPLVLLEDRSSILYNFVSKLGETEYKRMVDIAVEHLKSKSNN